MAFSPGLVPARNWVCKLVQKIMMCL